MNDDARVATTTWLWPASLAIVCTALAFLCATDPASLHRFDYAREPLLRGEWWRLVSAHLVHLSASHAALDIAALLLVGRIFGSSFVTRQLVLLTVFAMCSIDASLWWLQPEVDRYAGLSGLLHAWFAAGATSWMLTPSRRNASEALISLEVTRGRWGAALLAGLAMKLAIESRSHAFWLGDAGFPVVTAAHRWGAAAGVVFAMTTAIIALARRPSAAGASRWR